MEQLVDIPKEAVMARKHIQLLAPLLPPGKLAVAVHGVPTRSSHNRAAQLIINEAARCRAHRVSGAAVVRVYLGMGRPKYESAQNTGASRDFYVDISENQREVRVHRMLLLFVIGFLLFCATSVFCKRI